MKRKDVCFISLLLVLNRIALAAGQDTEQSTNDNKLLCMAEMVTHIESRYA